MFERYQKLLPELQLRIIEIYFQDAMFTLTNNKAILTDAHPKRHAILFVSHEMRKQAFPVFLSTSTFRIELDYLKQKKRNDHHLYMRHIAIHGCTIRASVDTLRDHFPDLRSLRIYYQPQVKINFGSLPTFVACKSSCCNDGFKRLLLNAISFGDDKSDECWISSLKGLKNRNALMGNSGFEIRLLMRIKTDFEHRGSSKFMVSAYSSLSIIALIHH